MFKKTKWGGFWRDRRDGEIGLDFLIGLFLFPRPVLGKSFGQDNEGNGRECGHLETL